MSRPAGVSARATARRGRRAPARAPVRAPVTISQSGERGGRAPKRPHRYHSIWNVVRRIPRGRVATYGQVADLAGIPRAPRVAGYALYALPEGSPIPWHRVVGAGGRLSLARLSPDGALTQRMRLEREGVQFDERGRVRMERHAWRIARARRT